MRHRHCGFIICGLNGLSIAENLERKWFGDNEADLKGPPSKIGNDKDALVAMWTAPPLP